MIGSKVTIILPPLFQKFKIFKCRHVGCVSRGNGLRIHTSIWVSVFEVRFQKSTKNFKIGLISESVFLDPTSDVIA